MDEKDSSKEGNKISHENIENGNHGNMKNMDNSDMEHVNINNMNHGGMEGMNMEDLRKKFWVSLILTIPIIILSPVMEMEIPFQITFLGSYWIVLAMGTVIYFYGGRVFFSSTKTKLKNKKPAIMTLITIGITVTYFYSVYSVFENNIFYIHPMLIDFIWELATLIDIMLVGHIIEMNSIMNAGSAVDKLAKLVPKKHIKLKT